MRIFDVPVSEFVARAAIELKKVQEVKAPEWALFVKTGRYKERPPVRTDWWHTRAASVLRKIAILGPVGVSKLRRKYGGQKNEGMAGEHTYLGSGNILRKILQQLEKSGLAKQGKKGSHKGRVLTPKGQKLLDSVAVQLMKEHNITIAPRKIVPEKKAAKRPPRKKSSDDHKRAPNSEPTARESLQSEIQAPKPEKKPEAPKVEKPKVAA